MLLSLLLVLQSGGPLDVEGVWWTRGGKAQVEIVRTEDGSVRGDVIWTDSAAAMASDGIVRRQHLAPEDRLGKTLLEGYEPADLRWSEGRIHDFEHGKSYRSALWRMDGDTLAVEGCLGIFCRTQEWARVAEDDIVRLELQSVELSVAGK